ncbi:sensor histidine kinase [Faecalicatena contorta]|uniref:sensor histidine kinase n=1 Tax=Faecalicatena contorta TaxID=39482 RepID=UPI0031CE5C07
MDTKLKNSHRLAVLLAIAVVLICSVGMVLAYPVFSREMQDRLDGSKVSNDEVIQIAGGLIEGNYILYNEVYEETDRAYVLQEYGGDRFDLLRKYMDYEVFDWDGNALLESNSKSVLENLVKKEDTTYAFRVAFTFQDDGELSDIQVNGNMLDERTEYEIEQYLLDQQVTNYEWRGISEPTEVQIVYGVTEENLNSYIDSNELNIDTSVAVLMSNSMFGGFLFLFAAVLAVTAVLLSVKKSFAFGGEKVFSAPFEIVVIVLGILASAIYYPAKVVWITLGGGAAEYLTGSSGAPNSAMSAIMNVAVWFVTFGIAFWGFVSLSAMLTMKKEYWKQRSLCVRFLRWMKQGGDEYGEKVKKGAGGIWSGIKRFCKRQYDVLMHLDFQDKTNRTIFKIIAINFVVLVVVCSLWYYGIVALIIYSVVLFLFLKKYSNDIQSKYKLLLSATNQLAEGDLDTPIEGDMGIFNPIQEEIKKIQNGFKKAVEEEVKSERMKTELITNVSHDLKTPLTAIITYTDLVKNETEDDKRKEYIDVLERKSLRLKVLIEDLFEISKATSKNITMNFMRVDIVDLLKQVGLEYDNKIKETNLDFRWSLPEHKIVLWLDSQKTYRIFENLILNITKYAMPHTRVYVEMKDLDHQVYISMKNISATELSFNTDEITDRFVRGDASRNTEGSGLGLAIAKTFTELQHGNLKISTEADLYKAEITFPKRPEVSEPQGEGARQNETAQDGNREIN